MKTITEQIAFKCIHFNGVMNTCCKAGIKYEDVRIGRPFKFPCLQQGGECSNSQFPTTAEVERELQELEELGIKSLAVFVLVKNHVIKTKEQSGKIPCPCSGEISFAVASINGHVRGNCSTCGISFNE